MTDAEKGNYTRKLDLRRKLSGLNRRHLDKLQIVSNAQADAETVNVEILKIVSELSKLEKE